MVADPIVKMTASFSMKVFVSQYDPREFFLSRDVMCNVSQAAEAYREAFEFCRDSVEEQAVAFAQSVGAKIPKTTRTPDGATPTPPVKEKGDNSNAAFAAKAKANSHETGAGPTLETHDCPQCGGSGVEIEESTGSDNTDIDEITVTCSVCHGKKSVSVQQNPKGVQPDAVKERIAEAQRKLAEQKSHEAVKTEEKALNEIASGKRAPRKKASPKGETEPEKRASTLPHDLDALEVAADAILASQKPAVTVPQSELGVTLADALASGATSSNAGPASSAQPVMESGGASTLAPPENPHETQTARLRALRVRIQEIGNLDEGPARMRVTEFLKGFTGKNNFTEGEPDNEPAIDLLTGTVRLLEMEEAESQSLLKQPLAFGEYCRKGYWELVRFFQMQNYSHELREEAWEVAAERYPCGGGKDLIEFLHGEVDPAARVKRIKEGK